MKLRLVTLLALIATGMVFAATPASAKPIPGIKQTVAYKQLKTNVDFLQSKRTVPASVSRKQAYKTKLTTRRNNATTKVLALFSQKVNRLSKQDDNKQRRDIKRILQNQKAQVQGLYADLNEQVSEIRADQAAAVQGVMNHFAPQINSRANKRDRLKAQLRRTTNPLRRSNLIRQINSLQLQINDLSNDRTTAVNKVNSRYGGKVTTVTAKYQQRIANVKANAQQQIQQERNAWRQTFRAQFQAAKTRRDAQKDMVATLATRGFGYIQQMPPVQE